MNKEEWTLPDKEKIKADKKLYKVTEAYLKYHCFNCRRSFEGFDDGLCPYCHSDNLVAQKKTKGDNRIMRIIKFLGLIILNLVTLPFYLLWILWEIAKDSWEKAGRKGFLPKWRY